MYLNLDLLYNISKFQEIFLYRNLNYKQDFTKSVNCYVFYNKQTQRVVFKSTTDEYNTNSIFFRESYYLDAKKNQYRFQNNDYYYNNNTLEIGEDYIDFRYIGFAKIKFYECYLKKLRQTEKDFLFGIRSL